MPAREPNSPTPAPMRAAAAPNAQGPARRRRARSSRRRRLRCRRAVRRARARPSRPTRRGRFWPVVELDHRQQALPAELLELGSRRPLEPAVPDDLVVDPLLIERALNLPAGVEVGVREGPGAAVQLDGGHGLSLVGAKGDVPAGNALWAASRPGSAQGMYSRMSSEHPGAPSATISPRSRRATAASTRSRCSRDCRATTTAPGRRSASGRTRAGARRWCRRSTRARASGCSMWRPVRAWSRRRWSGATAWTSSASIRARRCSPAASSHRRAPRLAECVTLVEGEAEGLPFADGGFDHLTFTYLLRYVEDPAATMRELARVVGRRANRVARVRRAGASRRTRCGARTPARASALGRRRRREWAQAAASWPAASPTSTPATRSRRSRRCGGPRASWTSAPRMSFGAGIVMWGRPSRRRRLNALDRPAFYALRPGGWRDFVTLLHPPTRLGTSPTSRSARRSPRFYGYRLAAALVAFFLAVGVGAHVLDELRDRPLRTI